MCVCVCVCVCVCISPSLSIILACFIRIFFFTIALTLLSWAWHEERWKLIYFGFYLALLFSIWALFWFKKKLKLSLIARRQVTNPLFIISHLSTEQVYHCLTTVIFSEPLFFVWLDRESDCSCSLLCLDMAHKRMLKVTRGILVKTQRCSREESMFEIQSHYYIHFRTNTFKKSYSYTFKVI